MRLVPLLLLSIVNPAVAPPAAEDNQADAACPAPEPGFLTLDTAPWTVVYVDGLYAGSTPLYRHRLAPGAHTVTLVNQERGVHVQEEVTVEEGRTRRLKLVLVADLAGTAVDASGDAALTADDCEIPVESTAHLSIDTRPWTRVFLDGRRVGSTPLFALPIRVGDHVVRLERDDGERVFVRFSAVAGEVVRLSLAVGPAPPAP